MKKLNLLLICSLFIIALIPLVTANIGISSFTVDEPDNSDSIRGIFNFTVTFVGNGSNSSVTTNITFYNDTTRTYVLCTIPASNLATANSTTGCINNTVGLSDDCTGHSIFAVYSNGSGFGVVNVTPTGIIFDNTNITISGFTADSDKVQIHKPLSYSVAGASDACDTSPTYSVVLTKPGSGGTVTKTTATGTWSLDDVSLLGGYSAIVTVSDNAGGQAVRSLTFDVTGSNDEDYLPTATQLPQKRASASNQGLILMGGVAFLFIIIAAGIGIAVFNKK